MLLLSILKKKHLSKSNNKLIDSIHVGLHKFKWNLSHWKSLVLIHVWQSTVDFLSIRYVNLIGNIIQLIDCSILLIELDRSYFNKSPLAVPTQNIE
jgi:hypothetical protein